MPSTTCVTPVLPWNAIGHEHTLDAGPQCRLRHRQGSGQHLERKPDDRLFCISVITEAELRFGLVRRAVNADLRRIVENFLVSVDIRPWASASAQRYGPLRKELEALGKPLAPMDLLIATHALTEDCTLISADRAFAQVPGLHLLDWSAAPK